MRVSKPLLRRAAELAGKNHSPYGAFVRSVIKNPRTRIVMNWLCLNFSSLRKVLSIADIREKVTG